LVGIWSGALAISEVGIHDNFLELGGNSLLASQIISRVIKTFRVELSVQSLFATPTVADMALIITQLAARRADQGEVERMLAELEQQSVRIGASEGSDKGFQSDNE